MSSSRNPSFELKYCERCGGLWLRPQGGEAVYCGRCAEAIRDLPAIAPRGGGSPVSAAAAAYGAIAGAPLSLWAIAGCLEVFA
jgi:hypothetical protein